MKPFSFFSPLPAYNKLLLFYLCSCKKSFRDDIFKQIPNSQVFLHVGIWCHFFSGAPNEVGVHSQVRSNEGTSSVQETHSHFTSLWGYGSIGATGGPQGGTAGLVVMAICFVRVTSYELEWHQNYRIWTVALSIPFPFPSSSPLSLSVCVTGFFSVKFSSTLTSLTKNICPND